MLCWRSNASLYENGYSKGVSDDVEDPIGVAKLAFSMESEAAVATFCVGADLVLGFAVLSLFKMAMRRPALSLEVVVVVLVVDGMW